MTDGRPLRGGQAHSSAVDRLDAAREERSNRRAAADEARGTPTEDTADDALRFAEDRVAAREAWLTWVERGF